MSYVKLEWNGGKTIAQVGHIKIVTGLGSQ